MNLLGAVLYDPSTAATASCANALAMTALDTTNLRISFTIPSHGMVRVRIATVIHGGNGPPMILLGVLNGSNVVARVAPMEMTLISATGLLKAVAEFVVTGLTPGAVSWDAAYGVETVVASSAIKWGGPNNTTANDAFGAFVFEVWDPQPQTSGTQLLVDGNGRVDVIKVAGTTQTAGDIIGDTNDIQSRLPAALTANGNMKSSLVEIIATALTETAGLLAGGFKKFFNVAAPTGTLNSIPDAVPGAAGGLTIAGSNAATTFATLTSTGAFSINGVSNVSQTGDSFARIGIAGVGLTNLGDTRIANLDATVSSRLAGAAYTAPDNTSITAIKGQTDKLTFTVANHVDANIQYVNDVQVNGAGTAGSPWGP